MLFSIGNNNTLKWKKKISSAYVFFKKDKLKYIVSWIDWAVYSTWIYSGLKHSYLIATQSSHPTGPFQKWCVSFGLVFIWEKICSETHPERSPSRKACSGGGPGIPDHHRMAESCRESAVTFLPQKRTYEEKLVLGPWHTVLIRSPLLLCTKIWHCSLKKKNCPTWNCCGKTSSRKWRKKPQRIKIFLLLCLQYLGKLWQLPIWGQREMPFNLSATCTRTSRSLRAGQ